MAKTRPLDLMSDGPEGRMLDGNPFIAQPVLEMADSKHLAFFVSGPALAQVTNEANQLGLRESAGVARRATTTSWSCRSCRSIDARES